MAGEGPAAARAKLLAVSGVGRETADSIALYAAGLPLFVVDAYTRRLFARLGLARGDEPYDDLQARVMSVLPADAALHNDLHAQIVEAGKRYCRPRPRCAECPLEAVCARISVVE
jgi:endonuclease-3 related protein